MRKSKKTSKLRVTGLCAGSSPLTGEFPAQMVNNAENVSMWWRHHELQHFESSHGNIDNASGILWYPNPCRSDFFWGGIAI